MRCAGNVDVVHYDHDTHASCHARPTQLGRSRGLQAGEVSFGCSLLDMCHEGLSWVLYEPEAKLLCNILFLNPKFNTPFLLREMVVNDQVIDVLGSDKLKLN